MKNAYVRQHHFGDDGNVTEGMILKDMTTKRFDALEKLGLVREATDAEVEAGYQPPFTPEADEADHPSQLFGDARQVAEQAQTFINDLRTEHEKALQSQTDRATAAETALSTAQKDLADMKTAHDTAGADLETARSEIEALKAAATKQERPAANKKAADPANKGA